MLRDRHSGHVMKDWGGGTPTFYIIIVAESSWVAHTADQGFCNLPLTHKNRLSFENILKIFLKTLRASIPWP